MKYVDNLLEVDPKDIRHMDDGRTPVQAIIKVAKPHCPHTPILVVFEDGESYLYTINGRYTLQGEQKFIFKPKKVRRLKPLHVVLAEAGNYRALGDGIICSKDWKYNIFPKIFPYFGTTNMPDEFYWDEKWIEEVDEVGV